MGINCLLPFLKKFSRKVNIREFSGQTAAIDASCWLHKGLSVSLSQSGRRDRWEIWELFVPDISFDKVKALIVFFAIISNQGVLIYSGVSKTQTSKTQTPDPRPQTPDLENPDLENTDLENADLEKADLENADLENTETTNVSKIL